jgi:C-terminal processing protease CtpA/Prc
MNTADPRSPASWRRWLVLLGLALVVLASASLLGWVREAQARAAQRLQAAELSRLQVALQESNRRLEQLQVSQGELERYRKQAEEVPRLRGQYQEYQRLKQEYDALKTELDRLRAGLAVPTAVSPGVASVLRGSWIGISLAQDPQGSGVSVSSVAPGGPAAIAGVQGGDVITAIDGRPVTSFQQVRDLIRVKPSGSLVLLDLVRQGNRVLVQVPTSPMPSFD